MRNSFNSVKMDENNPKWENSIKRNTLLYSRNIELRSNFERDYNRIINCNAYKRMKNKTQVFFSPKNDHICTRSEHVVHVESVSYSIANYLGLNTELTKAIATAHDMGHSPFGHQGERILSEIMQRDIGERFWHEKNGVYIADKIELLEDSSDNKQNLNLCYAVRDGIISHCGEIDENNLSPRDEAIDLNAYLRPAQYKPYTWEGCVVKVSDKIAYLGRDIEDATRLGILDDHLDELYKILDFPISEKINNTTIINNLVVDLCENSSIENGLCFSQKYFEMLNKIKEFNYENIYLSDRLLVSTEYFKLVINTIYNVLKKCYSNDEKMENMQKVKKEYPSVVNNFEVWLSNYWNLDRKESNKNSIIYNVFDEKDFSKAIIIYISGMTDNYAIKTYNDIINF